MILAKIARMSFPSVAAALAALLAAGPVVTAAENWTRFRGPNGTGVSTATNLPVEFGPEKNVKWKTALPPGHSSPVLTDSHIFLTAHSPEKDAYKLFVIALDRKTGKRAVAARGAAAAERAAARTSTARRRRARSPTAPTSTLLPGLRPDQLHRRRQGALAPAARAVQHVLRLRRVADPRRRHC